MRPSRSAEAEPWPPFKSCLPGVLWPAIPGKQGVILASLLAQFEQTQWLPAADLERAQAGQLRLLVEHARRHSRFHGERLDSTVLSGADCLRDLLSAIPVMERGDLQSRRVDIDCKLVPPEHGEVTVAHSTGSTGEPVAVRRTGMNALVWMAMTLREHLWHGRDFSRPLAIIRATFPAGDEERRGVRLDDWGPPVNQLFASGPSFGLNLQTDIARQAEWLRGIMPSYLLTYPNNLAALLDVAESDPEMRAGLAGLVQVRTIGETVKDEVRTRCADLLGVGIADAYSSQEVGVIAIQCSGGDGYHVMSEGLVLEILRDDGTPCSAGETGRVVLTDLHNFATPLIRYDIGDLAEVGAPCGCGRGLPTIRRILGRVRNLLRLPDGRRLWPLVGAWLYRDVAPVRQYQVVQRSLENVLLRLAVERPLSPEEEGRLAATLAQFLGHPFKVDFEYCGTSIPRGPGGKFEDFVCQIPG